MRLVDLLRKQEKKTAESSDFALFYLDSIYKKCGEMMEFSPTGTRKRVSVTEIEFMSAIIDK